MKGQSSTVLALLLVLLATASTKRAPPILGWSSWNQLGCEHLTESSILSQAAAMKHTGLLELGWSMIALDDCWQASSRDADGALQADPARFPGGMANLSSQLHSLGFQLGLYTCAGEYTCQLRPGALGHECDDAAQYASWGVDVIKEVCECVRVCVRVYV